MTSQAIIHQIQTDLYLIELPIPIAGFGGFIGTWVYTAGPVVLIDVGPAVSAPALLAALTSLGVEAPAYILLTHIHIDHSGGIGPVGKAFPHAQVVCHPKAIEHLVEPQRLWQGSLKTLGAIAQAYGPIEPIHLRQVVGSDRFQSSHVRCIATPGHAAHHVSYLLGDLLFAGEAGGVCLPTPGNGMYLRPATPPRFFLETSLESIDALLALHPRNICYGHIGLQSDAVQLLKTHRDQLVLWRELIQPYVQSTHLSTKEAQDACRDHLLEADPLLADWSGLPRDTQQREIGFLCNSIKGYWGYLATYSTRP